MVEPITSDVKKKTKDIFVLFNNNSGGDTADNAKQLMKVDEYYIWRAET